MTSTPRPMHKLSLKFSMIEEKGLSVLEAFRLVRDLGFDGVELDSPGELSRAEVIAARNETGLAIPGLICSRHWTTPLTDPDPAVRQACIDAMLVAIEDAVAFGATTVLLVPGAVNAAVSYATAWDRAIDGVTKILPHAEAAGVAVAIENVWNDFLLSPLEAARFIDAFGSPAIGWYFDVGNVLRYGRPVHWIEALGRRILKVDVKEFSLARMTDEGLWTGFDVPLGEGDCDWPAVNAALAAVGYSGWASVEVPGGDRLRLAEIKRRLDAVAGS